MINKLREEHNSLDKFQRLSNLKDIVKCKALLISTTGYMNALGEVSKIDSILDNWKSTVKKLDELIVHIMQRDENIQLEKEIEHYSHRLSPLEDFFLDNYKKTNVYSTTSESIENKLKFQCISDIKTIKDSMVSVYDQYMSGDTFIMDFGDIMFEVNKTGRELEELA